MAGKSKEKLKCPAAVAGQEMTPFEDFVYLLNAVLLGDEPTIEDFILLIGTTVAFVAFVLWCCFPIGPKNLESQHDDEMAMYQCKRMDSNNHT